MAPTINLNSAAAAKKKKNSRLVVAQVIDFTGEIDWFTIDPTYLSPLKEGDIGRCAELPEMTVPYKFPVHKLDHYQTAHCAGKVYIVGGCSRDSPKVCSKKVLIFDLDSKKWEEGPQMNVARAFPVLVPIGNVLYVFGGRNDDNSITIENWAEFLDVNVGSGGTWKLLNSHPPLELFKSATLNFNAVHERSNQILLWVPSKFFSYNYATGYWDTLDTGLNRIVSQMSLYQVAIVEDVMFFSYSGKIYAWDLSSDKMVLEYTITSTTCNFGKPPLFGSERGPSYLVQVESDALLLIYWSCFQDTNKLHYFRFQIRKSLSHDSDNGGSGLSLLPEGSGFHHPAGCKLGFAFVTGGNETASTINHATPNTVALKDKYNGLVCAPFMNINTHWNINWVIIDPHYSSPLKEGDIGRCAEFPEMTFPQDLDLKELVHYQFAYCAGKVYFVGGHLREYPHDYSKKVFIFNLDSKTWEEGPQMKIARAEHVLLAIGNVLYVFGGTTDDEKTIPIEKWSEFLDVGFGKTWEHLESYPPLELFEKAIVILHAVDACRDRILLWVPQKFFSYNYVTGHWGSLESDLNKLVSRMCLFQVAIVEDVMFLPYFGTIYAWDLSRDHMLFTHTITASYTTKFGVPDPYYALPSYDFLVPVGSDTLLFIHWNHFELTNKLHYYRFRILKSSTHVPDNRGSSLCLLPDGFGFSNLLGALYGDAVLELPASF